MENERNTDKLAGYLIKLGIAAAIIALCWYFKNVLIDIIIAFVISLIGFPIMTMLRKLKIKGKSAPDWLLAVLTIVLIIILLVLLVTQIIPLISNIIRDVSSISSSTYFSSNPIDMLNDWIIATFPNIGTDFDLTTILLDKMKELVNINNVSGIVGSVASVVTSAFVGLFSVVFISFFFIKDNSLFEKIIGALVPDRHEANVSKTLNDIKQLLSRYFVGLLLEMVGVTLVDFLGLWLIARLPVSYALGIAFIAGLLNVIPYVGPLMGEGIGVILGIVIKLGTGVGIGTNIWVFALIVWAIMLAAQLIDNFIYQPVIYSTSIKAHPLEIFIVLLMAGHIGGTAGMLVAIPAYTVVRVIAIRFFYRFKPIQRPIPDLSEEDKIIENVD
jgi:predicted PurR-regulated permease PerM